MGFELGGSILLMAFSRPVVVVARAIFPSGLNRKDDGEEREDGGESHIDWLLTCGLR